MTHASPAPRVPPNAPATHQLPPLSPALSALGALGGLAACVAAGWGLGFPSGDTMAAALTRLLTGALVCLAPLGAVGGVVGAYQVDRRVFAASPAACWAPLRTCALLAAAALGSLALLASLPTGLVLTAAGWYGPGGVGMRHLSGLPTGQP